MEKIYKPKNIEQPIYKFWEESGYFKPNNNITKNRYCIMIPPPNITGNLHMGHAFQQTIIDALIRYNRMQGKNTLLQAGTDHAGIATQIIMEQKIFTEEGKNKYDYGRDIFVKKILEWKYKYNKNIKNQMRRLGNSIDWERERFTMDKKFSKSVNEAFVQLYKNGFIYKRKCLVNWDIKLQTAISDLEVENKEIKSFMWYLRYPLEKQNNSVNELNYVVVATTRPETLFGDTAIAVHPKDMRYKKLIGKFVILPFVNRRIPIIGDDYVNINKGTGCVKITPAHDFNDYKIGKRHKLPIVNIFTIDGNICSKLKIFNTEGKEIKNKFNEIPSIFCDLERFKARKIIIKELNKLGLLADTKVYNKTIQYNDRSGVIIEPMLTDQWYMRMSSLASVAIKAVESGEIKFIPKQYENMYFSWMRNIQDWCISRQLWWGHQIPAWYDKKNNIYVGRSELEVRKKYKLNDNFFLKRDENVLDTWFSSSLWTFASLGWPENSKELRIFHPINVIVSGFDIIFFWISRMIMLTMYFIKDDNGNPQVPFKTIYITGLIKDEKGQKMSKSKGNVIDPIDIADGISLKNLLKKRTDYMLQNKFKNKIYQNTKKYFPNGILEYGIDALRITLTSLASTSRDINLDIKRIEGYRNFCNKLWNASRFILNNIKDQNFSLKNKPQILSSADLWINIEFNNLVKKFRESFDNYRFDLATNVLYEFVRNKFCDWYLEFAKSTIKNGNNFELFATRYTLLNILESLLRLAHPIIPFITETIWQKIKAFINVKNDTIMLQSFPVYNKFINGKDIIQDIEWIQNIIIEIRAIRIRMNIPFNTSIILLLKEEDKILKCKIKKNQNFILKLANIKKIDFLKKEETGPISINTFIGKTEILIPISWKINKNYNIKQLEKKILYIENEINKINMKLKNKKFIKNAPDNIIEKERKKLRDYIISKEKILNQKLDIN